MFTTLQLSGGAIFKLFQQIASNRYVGTHYHINIWWRRRRN